MALGRKTGGRLKGTPNKATAERQAMAEASGIMPPELMLENARHFYELALTAEDEAAELQGESTAPNVRAIAKAREATALRKDAQECARDAAPYFSPRLAAVAHSGNVTLSHEEALDELERPGTGDPDRAAG